MHLPMSLWDIELKGLPKGKCTEESVETEVAGDDSAVPPSFPQLGIEIDQTLNANWRQTHSTVAENPKPTQISYGAVLLLALVSWALSQSFQCKHFISQEVVNYLAFMGTDEGEINNNICVLKCDTV